MAVTVGHIPTVSLTQLTKFQATVYDTKAKPLPLIQGRLEISIKVKIIWSHKEKLLKVVKYPMTDKHNDLKSILNKTGVHNHEEDNADVAHDDN